ncbi:MAG: FtsX-like permease family protein [Dactylosporangium sp.]|nr:ABC transporter permease [Dactylosporangium sp.]NNJ62492.1 FtsX-like permease family protein [Dactylosporangium sp.]
MLRATLRSLLARKLRLLTSMFAIVLSVAFLSASFVLTETLSTGFTRLVASFTEGLDVLVSPRIDRTSAGEPAYLDDADLAAIRAVPGVASVQAAVGDHDQVMAIGRDGRVLLTSGSHLVGNWRPALPGVTLRAGRAPRAATEVVINRRLATAGPFAPGDALTVRDRDGARRTFTVAGIATDDQRQGDNSFSMYFTDATAQDLVFGQTGRYQGALVDATPGTSVNRLSADVRSVLGDRFEVSTGAERGTELLETVRKSLDSVRQGLLGFVGFALFIGAFLILNTFSIIVAQRLRELALLRAVGASRCQIIGSVLTEAVATGLVASAIGLAVGVGLGRLGADFLATRIESLTLSGVSVPATAVVTSFAVGTGVTVLAAVLPALRASRTSPVVAMGAPAAPERPMARRLVAGVAVGACGAGLLAYGLPAAEDSDSGLWWVLAGVVAVLLALILVMPILVRPVTGLIGRILAWSAPGKLGRRNAARQPRRTATTASAMMISIALITVLGTILKSEIAQTGQSMDRTMRADLVVGPERWNHGTVRAGLRDQIAQIPGVASAAAVGQVTAAIGGRLHQVNVVSDAADVARAAGLTAVAGRIDRLGGTEILVDQDTADREHLRIGDPIPIGDGRGETHDYTVAGILTPNALVTGFVLALPPVETGWPAYARFPVYSQLYTEVDDGADPATVRDAIAGLLADEPGITIATRQQFIGERSGANDDGLIVIQLLTLLAMVIAALGVINTLALSVIERTRELGLLRAIGLRRAQVIRMVAVESIVISLLGAVVGLGAGVGLGATIITAGMEQAPIIIPWDMAATYLIGATVVGLLASIAPAVRAARLNVLAAVAYE